MACSADSVAELEKKYANVPALYDPAQGEKKAPISR
jgi:hypothetical protein